MKKQKLNEKNVIVSSRSHTDKSMKAFLNSIPNSEVSYHGGCGFKSILLINNEADCFLYPSKGYKR